MPRPVIGLTGYFEMKANWGALGEVPAVLLPHAYTRSVSDAGGRPVILPPDEVDTEILARLDGLILSGGPDIDPVHYGQPLNPKAKLRPGRDKAELALLAAARRIDLPVLGICRGMQLMAVGYGGRLHQYLPDDIGHPNHRPAPGTFGRHEAHFASGSWAARIFGERREVNSYHNQGVVDPGTLVPTGWAADGLVEALEDPNARFALGVQWHPEEEDLELFEAFVDVTRRRP